MDELREAGDEITHYLIDHPDLPFDPLPPPRGLPEQLADDVPGIPTDPTTRFGEHSPTRDGTYRGPFLGIQLECTDAERVGGEGLAFVMQSVGVDAAGCAGNGLGYAGASGGYPCERSGIPRSVAVQFDTHHNARTVRHETCIDLDTVSNTCKPGGMKVSESLVFDRQHAVSVYLGGVNEKGTEVATYLLSGRQPSQFDDGNAHEAHIVYRPPVGGESGVLEVAFDGQPHALVSLPLTLPFSHDGFLFPGDAPGFNATASGAPHRAYFGFTASTGEASERHDILRARFCHKLGCATL
jgi:hypothetical protein